MIWLNERDQVDEITFSFLLMRLVARLSGLSQLPDQRLDCSGSTTKAGQVTVLHINT